MTHRRPLEADYFAALASVSSYLLLETGMVLVDASGVPILTYQAAPASPVAGAWVVTKYRNGGGSFMEPIEGSVLTLVLEPDGRGHGFNGCDRFDVLYVLEGSDIVFSPPSIGPRPCASSSLQSQADGFLGGLSHVRTWAFADTELKLANEEGSTQIGLLPAPAPIFARAWTPTAVADATGVLVPVLPDSNLGLDFQGDGHVSGSTGCNGLYGLYQVAGASIHLGPLGTTRIACPTDELAVQEANYLAALDAATSWTLDGQSLVLLAPNGATVMTLVTQPDIAPSPVPTAEATPSPTPKPTPKPTAETVVVPDVVGDQEADALVALGAAGLNAGEKASKYDNDKKGTVISTDPKAGVVVQSGTDVDYTVSRGPSPSPSPTPKPTAKPTPKPTAKPTPKPTAKPTPKPTAQAHGQADTQAHAPSRRPSPRPSRHPSPPPSRRPSPRPSPPRRRRIP